MAIARAKQGKLVSDNLGFSLGSLFMFRSFINGKCYGEMILCERVFY